MATTSIEWTRGDDGAPGTAWNPSTGCDRVSPGCDNCYALSYAKRLKGMGQAKYQTDGDPRTSGPGFGLAMHDDALLLPLTWRKPRRIFVNSMSDLFHGQVTDEFIARVFAVMAATPRHTYQLLTKRHARMRSLLSGAKVNGLLDHISAELLSRGFSGGIGWPLPNLWLGVSVEDQKCADLRIDALLDTPAAVRWISAEPLLGPVDLSSWLPCPKCGAKYPLPEAYDDDLLCHCTPPDGALDWIVIGGESGPGARPMQLDWATSLVDQCQAVGVPVFVKQLGSRIGPGKGGDIHTWPEELRVRDYPQEVGG